MALTFFLSQDSQTEPNVAAMCAPRRWRRRSTEDCDQKCKSSFCQKKSCNNLHIQIAIFERRRHLRGAHMAPKFLLPYKDNETERRRRMRSAQTAPTFN